MSVDADAVSAVLPSAMERFWDRTPSSITVLEGGMNSVAVRVELSDGAFVAKWVPAQSRDALIAGAVTAAIVESGGIPAGAPMPTAEGGLTVPLLDGELVLLAFVAGAPLTASPSDQWDWGRTLAMVHARLPRRRGSVFFPWLADATRSETLEPRDRRAIAGVLSEFASLRDLTWAQLHTDPEPGAFLRGDDGEIGVIDWTGSVPGPALYDLASAVMYAGGEVAATPLIDAYLAEGAVSGAEVRRHLGALGRFRAAVQIAYFAQRLAEGDLTGILSADDNRKGLDDGRRMLDELSGSPH